jgi:hypothetical protein
MPVSTSAMPMTMLKSATCWAKYEVFRAVLSAVSVTHTLRAGLSTGEPSGRFWAAFGSSIRCRTR